MASRSRTNVLARIRRRNAKLPSQEAISVSRGLTTIELKRLEKTLNAKIKLNEAGIDTSNIQTPLTTQASTKLREVGRAIVVDSPDLLAQSLKDIKRTFGTTIQGVQQDLKGLEGFGNIEFIQETLLSDISSENKLLKQDAETFVRAITDPDFATKTIKRLVDRTNESLRLQGLDQIVFDEFDIDDTIQKLNAVDQRTKNIARYIEFDEDIVEEIF